MTDGVLDRLRDLRAAVLGGLERAPDLDALRRLLQELFECVVYWPSAEPPRDGTPLPIDEPESADWEGSPVAAEGAYLLPILRRGVVVGYHADPRNVPAEERDLPEPKQIVGRRAIDQEAARISEREGFNTNSSISPRATSFGKPALRAGGAWCDAKCPSAGRPNRNKNLRALGPPQLRGGP